MMTHFVGLRLSDQERAELDKIAQATGRTRSNVARALLLMAASDPRYRQRLGDLSTTQAPAAKDRT